MHTIEPMRIRPHAQAFVRAYVVRAGVRACVEDDACSLQPHNQENGSLSVRDSFSPLWHLFFRSYADM
eukprot:2519835-Pleurochrysis_carterae.AAC.9